MSNRQLLTVSFLFFLFQQTYAQRNYEGYNFLGIQGGISFFDIQTDDLVTEQREGFIAGFTTRGGFRNNFDLIYGISFQSESVGVEGSDPLGTDTQKIGYSVQGVQINFMGSYNIIMKHLSVELGPVFSINGKMKLDREEYEDYILAGYNTLTAAEIQDISVFNVRLAAGLTTGLEHFRISAQYQYGLTNMLGKLNDQGLENNDFKGNSSTIILMGVIYF
ncbi:outer membrane beta-barrel protein [Aequorivita sp. SDUM287046]|uniref:Outer membrane beta-barrel protein n=1 Tax=Aequorivita aurantiaca TaxID=3053356 RepID=A0ABT8DGN5_9FLAO|nr:outer membrane beta-barrel protein [Aequorivita aurantiaca]MDN3723079.1 outer membrane beta-barrel protein [Aequorivita aurantiaca]